MGDEGADGTPGLKPGQHGGNCLRRIALPLPTGKDAVAEFGFAGFRFGKASAEGADERAASQNRAWAWMTHYEVAAPANGFGRLGEELEQVVEYMRLPVLVRPFLGNDGVDTGTEFAAHVESVSLLNVERLGSDGDQVEAGSLYLRKDWMGCRSDGNQGRIVCHESPLKMPLDRIQRGLPMK